MASYARDLRLSPASRLATLAGATLLQAMLLLLLISALAVSVVDKVTRPSDPPMIAIVPIDPPPEPVVVEPVKVQPTPQPAGGSPLPVFAPAAIEPTPTVVPAPLVAPPAPVGEAPSRSGTSGNGAGAGTGSGSGIGTGVGAGGGVAIGARRLRGSITADDYPPGPRRARISGTSGVSLAISDSGRVEGCTVFRSSGNAELDSTVCTLARQRFVFRPARNAEGVAIAATKKEYFTWVLP